MLVSHLIGGLSMGYSHARYGQYGKKPSRHETAKLISWFTIFPGIAGKGPGFW